MLSNADPKRTFLGLVEAAALPAEFREAVRGIKMDGPCAKVNLVLSEEPRVHGHAECVLRAERALFTLVPSLEFAERCYDIGQARRGPRGAVGRLRGRLERGRHPGPGRPSRDDLLRPVRARIG